MPVTIYVLMHPVTNEVRYVGKTSSPLSVRWQGHIDAARKNKDKRAPRTRWLRKLLSQDLKPIILPVERVKDGGDWVSAERKWIAHYRAALGNRLLNVTEGGEGIHGYRYTDEQRQAISERQRGKPSPRRGRPSSAELCRKQSEAHLLRQATIRATRYAEVYMEEAKDWWFSLPKDERWAIRKAATRARQEEKKERERALRVRWSPSPEHRAKIAESSRRNLTGRALPDAVKAKVSAKLKGIPKSPETRAKMCAAQKGRIITPEARAKISATLKARAKEGRTQTLSF